MSKYPKPKKNNKSDDKFTSKAGQFEIYKDGKKISNDSLIKFLKK